MPAAGAHPRALHELCRCAQTATNLKTNRLRVKVAINIGVIVAKTTTQTFCKAIVTFTTNTAAFLCQWPTVEGSMQLLAAAMMAIELQARVSAKQRQGKRQEQTAVLLHIAPPGGNTSTFAFVANVDD